VRLALMALKGEPGYPTALTAPTWGFHDVVNRGKPLTLGRPLGSYVMEHVLFKIGYPAEFHGQTAVEAGIRLHPQVAHRLDEIERIRLETQESAVRIIDKRGLLRNPADRDHCIQYMTAVGLLKGALSADDYEDQAAADPRIDHLRERMEVVENARYSRDYLDPDLRSVANAVQIFFKDGSSTAQVAIEYPLGHPRRREEGLPLLREKFEDAVATRFSPDRIEALTVRFADPVALRTSAVHELVNLFVP
jgi:2-methylcitrate dehydratase